ncbi:aldo/keto reductase [Methanosphaera sp. WGK6]|uniref:aldo/keto reductase n=1 Tax=Methanosphaera sp. WGK6 TaxID=1561964 RepID=UPI00084C9461|nr:aldo/keto reductase [Methanosphaera sp. WGK6]OED29886.1 aldo/keto reductase [Methanosphaera sp. WGK6]
MEYRTIGNTGIKISEIAFGAEWMGAFSDEEVTELVKYCKKQGINSLDCWMSDPDIRRKLGNAIADDREYWIIQGHIGSTWQNNQYVRTRDMTQVKKSFKDLLDKFNTDYMDFGMIHYVDEVKEYEKIMNGEFIEYVRQLKKENKIHHIGISTHNADVALLAAREEEIELILFSINPAFDIMPATEDLEVYRDNSKYTADLNSIDPKRVELYQLCEDNNTALTVMKGYDGGILFDEKESPFGVALTPVHCIEYALSRPAVKSIFVGIKTIKELDGALEYYNATEEEKDYNKILAKSTKRSFEGQCTYCGHCAPCPVNINVAMITKYHDLAVIQEEVPESIREHYNNLQAHASDCIECGGCEDRCPFNVKIIELMHKAEKLFGN